jgi:hypothetical protein
MIGWKVCSLSLSQCIDINEWMIGKRDDWMESLSTECIESMHRYK